MPKLVWKSPAEISDGNHKGEVTRVVDRPVTDDNKYHYIDIWIKLDDSDVEIKYGCPANLSPKSKLGRLLLTMGAEFKVDAEIDPEEYLVGKKVRFMTMKKGDFSEIVEDSIKPDFDGEKQPIETIQA